MPVTKQNRFLLLYGSQTGQAKAIAEEIAEKSAENHLHADIHCLSMTEKKFYIEREKCVVIVTSTTGDGEPPDTALKFIRRLKKKTLPGDYLGHLNYALLGTERHTKLNIGPHMDRLGDSNYTNFCNCGRNLDKRLLELGAKRFYDCGWADDAVGLEVAVEPWIDGLLAAVKRQLYGSNTDSSIFDHTREVIKLNREAQLSTPVESNDNTSVHSGSDVTAKATPVDQSHSSDAGTVRTKRQESENTNQSNSVKNSNAEKKDINAEIGNAEQTTNKSDSISRDKQESIMESATVSLTSKLDSLALIDQSKVLDRLTASQNSLPDLKLAIQSNEQAGDPTENRTTHSVDSSSNSNLSEETETSSSVQTEEGSLSVESLSLDIPNIRQSVPPLSDSNLNVPVLSPAYLKMDYQPGVQLNTSDLPLQNGCQFTSAASPVAVATVISAVTVTTCDAVKKAMSVQLDISECNIQYEPGDSFSLICPNDSVEVENLLRRLGVSDTADTVYELSVLPDTKKKNAALPKHVPERGTLRYLFTSCLDIREPPKKALLRVLVEYTSGSGKQRRLQELCSRQGSDDYARFIRGPSLSLLDILNHFNSCSPPVERIIEHLPRLQPRSYSICSSPLVTPGSVEFVFNVVDIDHCCGRTYSRKGVCTGWLEKFETCKESSEDTKVSNCCDVPVVRKVPVFARTSQYFHLPRDFSTPVIMIGPGIGVAPFLGFLRHMAALRGSGLCQVLGESWLFYGCRHRDKDYLYREELQDHLSIGNLTQLCVCFSRDDQSGGSPRYVQDNIRAQGATLVKLIEEQHAMVFVCGDARNMATDVNQAFVDIFCSQKGLTQEEAVKHVMQMRLHKRYLEDVWT